MSLITCSMVATRLARACEKAFWIHEKTMVIFP